MIQLNTKSSLILWMYGHIINMLMEKFKRSSVSKNMTLANLKKPNSHLVIFHKLDGNTFSKECKTARVQKLKRLETQPLIKKQWHTTWSTMKVALKNMKLWKTYQNFLKISLMIQENTTHLCELWLIGAIISTLMKNFILLIKLRIISILRKILKPNPMMIAVD